MLNEKPIQYQTWPYADETKIIIKNIQIGIQINGKVRSQIEILPNWSNEEIIENAKKLDNVAKWLQGHEIVKVIYKDFKILNFIK
ncbi:hypothetical protein [Metamycoplasma hominis]|uniref:hypothetical protein n=1 Tax=Metamycoplasma hominis TaxID=2098 RepID=UPI001314864C|nr:hypothetical protein [Metamycoplasma hominis]